MRPKEYVRQRMAELAAANKHKEAALQVEEQKPEVPTGPSTPLTQEQIAFMMTLIDKMGEKQIEAIREMKKPTPEEESRLKKQKDKELREIQARIQVGEAEQRRRTAQQAICRHKRPDETWAVSGQVFSADKPEDEKVMLMCLQCQKFVYIGPATAQFRQGIGYKVHLNIAN